MVKTIITMETDNEADFLKALDELKKGILDDAGTQLMDGSYLIGTSLIEFGNKE